MASIQSLASPLLQPSPSCQAKVITRILLLICLSVVTCATVAASPSWSLFPSWINDPVSRVNLHSLPFFFSSGGKEISGTGRAAAAGSMDPSFSATRASGQPGESDRSSSDAATTSNIWNNFLPSSLSNYIHWLQSAEEWTGYEGSDLQDFNDLSFSFPTTLDSRSIPSSEKQKQIPSGTARDPRLIQGFLNGLHRLVKQGRLLVPAANSLTMAYDSLVQTMTCLSNEEFEDPDLGRFDMNASLYCNIACGRAIPGVLCCNPTRPELLSVHFRLKIKGGEEKILNFRDPSHVKYLSAPGRIVFIVHGFMERMSAAKWLTEMRNAFADQQENAIIVDWRRGNAGHYWQAMANTRVIAAMIGRAILNWGIADRTLLVGFSLGAQIAGEAGRFTQRHGNVMINECHGLDPAGPFYDGCSDEIQLDKSDCRLVQAIHTSAEDYRVIGPLAMRFGTYKKTGHCDYWINCGHTQGLCNDIKFSDLMKAMTRAMMHRSDGEMANILVNQACSHGRAFEVYVSSLKNRCKYPAYPCPACGKYGSSVDCRTGTPEFTNNTLPPFSVCDPTRDENYFVSSETYHPYCEI